MENTYQPFEMATYEQVKKYLEEFGCKDNLSEQQNDSPTVQEFLDLYTEFPFITYIGYIIKKPREDYRVSIEGFEIKNLTADEALDLYDRFDNADEKNKREMITKEMPILYNVRFWWD